MSRDRGLPPGELLAMGWLPRRAAAEAMGMTPQELDRAVADKAIRTRAFGPRGRMRLYEVIAP